MFNAEDFPTPKKADKGGINGTRDIGRFVNAKEIQVMYAIKLIG